MDKQNICLIVFLLLFLTLIIYLTKQYFIKNKIQSSIGGAYPISNNNSFMTFHSNADIDPHIPDDDPIYIEKTHKKPDNSNQSYHLMPNGHLEIPKLPMAIENHHKPILMCGAKTPISSTSQNLMSYQTRSQTSIEGFDNSPNQMDLPSINNNETNLTNWINNSDSNNKFTPQEQLQILIQKFGVPKLFDKDKDGSAIWKRAQLQSKGFCFHKISIFDIPNEFIEVQYTIPKISQFSNNISQLALSLQLLSSSLNFSPTNYILTAKGNSLFYVIALLISAKRYLFGQIDINLAKQQLSILPNQLDQSSFTYDPQLFDQLINEFCATNCINSQNIITSPINQMYPIQASASQMPINHLISNANQSLITNQVNPNSIFPNQILPNQNFYNQIPSTQIPSNQMPITNLVYPNQIPYNPISPNQISNNQVFTSQIPGNQLFPNQIFPNQILNNQVIPNQISNNQVIPNQIFPNQISNNQIPGNQISGNQIFPNQIPNVNQIPTTQIPTNQIFPNQTNY